MKAVALNFFSPKDPKTGSLKLQNECNGFNNSLSMLRKECLKFVNAQGCIYEDLLKITFSLKSSLKIFLNLTENVDFLKFPVELLHFNECKLELKHTFYILNYFYFTIYQCLILLVAFKIK